MPKKVLEGVVLSNKLDKTCTVLVSRRIQHNKYAKIMTSSKKYLVHDPENSVILGSTVLIEESRPLSARKRFVLKEILAAGDSM
jgi:small subunit ribosomal protein S17